MLCRNYVFLEITSMKIVTDFRIKDNFSPSLFAFFEELWLDLAIAEPASGYLFLVNEEMQINTTQENISARVLKTSAIKLLNKNRLLKTLNGYHADRYITLEEDGYSIIRPATKEFTAKDLLQPSARIFFSGNKPTAAALSGDIHFIKPVAKNTVTSLSWTEAESIKTQHTAGRDFFLFTGDIDDRHRLIELLKAFSLFKKWQQSNMQLVIAGYPVLQTGAFEEQLASYKYRHDVILLKNLPQHEIATLTAAAYAVVYPAEQNILSLTLLQAIQCGVAIIASDTEANRQLTDTAIWVDNNHLQEGFANAMMLLYKDENQKQQLVEKVKEQAGSFAREKMLGEVWQSIN